MAWEENGGVIVNARGGRAEAKTPPFCWLGNLHLFRIASVVLRVWRLALFAQAFSQKRPSACARIVRFVQALFCQIAVMLPGSLSPDTIPLKNSVSEVKLSSGLGRNGGELVDYGPR